MKIAILSSIAYNEFVDYRNIHTEGITKITPTDMKYAEAMDSVIKLIGISKRVGDRIFARVSPVIISRQHPLANVEDVFNGIVVKGDAIGDAMFYGRGAGKLPTASAVVADIIDIAKHQDSGVGSVWIRKEENNVLDINESETRYFIRVGIRNVDEARKYIIKTFEDVEFIRLDGLLCGDELAFATGLAPEGKLAYGVEALSGIGSIKNVINVIRIEED